MAPQHWHLRRRAEVLVSEWRQKPEGELLKGRAEEMLVIEAARVQRAVLMVEEVHEHAARNCAAYQQMPIGTASASVGSRSPMVQTMFCVSVLHALQAARLLPAMDGRDQMMPLEQWRGACEELDLKMVCQRAFARAFECPPASGGEAGAAGAE